MASGAHILSPELKKELISMKPSEITHDWIAANFGYTTSPTKDNKFEIKEPRFHTTYRVHLEPKEYINERAVDTNCGIILFNKLLVEGMADEFIPNHFFNEVVTKKVFGKLTKALSDAIRNGKLRLDDPEDTRFSNFLRAYEFWALKLPAIFSPSYTISMIRSNKNVMQEKEKLLAKNPPKTLEEMVRFEDKLIDTALKETEGDPGRTIFDSGARGSFSNDYKNMSIMVGAVQSPITGKYELMTSNYIDGIKKEDLAHAGNIVVNSEYPKAIGTAHGGYITKQFYAGFQGITLGPPNSDCGTKETLSYYVTPENANSLIDQYVMEDGKPVLLKTDNIGKYYGKEVHLRSPMFCLSKDHYCSICMGERYYKIGIDSIGLTAVRISNNLMKKNLKMRHNMKFEMNEIDPDTVLIKPGGANG